MRTGSVHHDRAIEACHRYVRQASCTARPIAYADYLHQSNREHRDSFQMSPACRRITDAYAANAKPTPESEPAREDEPVRAITRPEVPHTETVRHVEFTYTIESDLPTGRLIDVLL